MTESRGSAYEIIYKMVLQIPRGKVATYGEVARLCGFPAHARLVGYALHNLKPDSGVPWHRVINSKGMISLPRDSYAYQRQKKLLEKEGITFKKGQVDLTRFGFAARTQKKSTSRRGQK